MLDFDDLATEVAQQQGGERAGNRGREVEHPDALQEVEAAPWRDFRQERVRELFA
jgi:hypothetical protein